MLGSAVFEYGLVTSRFAFFAQPAPQHPHHRVEPEERFGQHLQTAREVVQPARVIKFMEEYRMELGRRQSSFYSFGHQNPVPPEAENTRLDSFIAQRWRKVKRNTLETAMREGLARGPTDAPPSREPLR